MSKLIDSIKRVFDRETPDKLIPVLAFDQGSSLFYTEDGYLAFALMSDPLPGVHEGVADKLAALLNSDWPASTFMQVSLYHSPVVHHIKAALRNFPDRAPLFAPDAILAEGDALCRSVVERKIDLIQDGTTSHLEAVGRTSSRDTVLVWSVKLPIKVADAPTEKEITNAKEGQRRVKQALISAGLRPFDLDARGYIRYTHSLLNWGDDAYWRNGEDTGYDETRFLNKQLLDLDNHVAIDREGVWLGKKRVKTMSPRRLPDFFSLYAMSAALGDPASQSKALPGNFVVNLNLHWPEYHDTKASIDKQRNYAVFYSAGGLGKFVPRMARRGRSFDLIHEALETGERPVQICPTIIVYADDNEQAAENVSQIRTYYTELGFQMQEDSYIAWPLILNSLPMCADKDAIQFLKRYFTVAGTHAAQFLPIAADWKGTGTPVLQYYGRFGQVQFVDLFDSQTNYNACITAESGSGKSFLTNDMVISYLSAGAKVWAIDVGRSYLKTCSAVGGQFIEFTPEAATCLNPFQLIKDFDEEVDMLTGLVVAMAFPTQPATDFQLQKLKEGLKACWVHYAHNMTIDSLVQYFYEQDDHRVKDIAAQLFSYTTSGEYGRFFNGDNNVSFDKQFIVLELEELKGREHLQQVVLLQLIYQIQQATFQGDRRQKKVVIIDEAWSLLSKGNVAKFLENGYRRFRKANTAAVTITQSVNDLYASPAGIAIAENSANMILLGQKRETVEALRKSGRLSIGDAGFELLKTVHTVRDEFSEIFFYMDGGNSAGIGRLIADRYTQLLYSTTPSDVTAIKDRTDSGMTTDMAIRDILAYQQ